jgi:hypothetical protein
MVADDVKMNLKTLFESQIKTIEQALKNVRRSMEQALQIKEKI